MRIDDRSTQGVNQSAQNQKSNSQLSVNDFLKIMAAEIQNQSPTGESGGGGSKTDYLTQLAQFTSLEQMNKISEELNQISLISQTSLIGKTVKIFGETEDITGVVDRVKFYNKQSYLQVGGIDYPLGALMEVENTVTHDPLVELLEMDTPFEEAE